jgi:ferritin-like metal-binding protein YciE
VSTARQVGDSETARVCEEILHDEEAMADWLQNNIPTLTQQYLSREETPGATAKR